MAKRNLSIICAAGLCNFLDWKNHIDRKKYNVRLFPVSSRQEIEAAIDWADIVWLDFCNEPAIYATQTLEQMRRAGKPIPKCIVRMHSYEAFTQMPSQVNWTVVNTLVYVNPEVKSIAESTNEKLAGDTGGGIAIIPNGVNLDVPEVNHGDGYDIAVVSSINSKKNPQMVLQILDALNERDSHGYTVHWAGAVQDERYKRYLDYMIDEMGLTKYVKFYGHVSDMETFWKGKNFLLHTSIFESFGYSIFEAAARGIIPIVHNFPGAQWLYDPDWLFDTVKAARWMIDDYVYNYESTARNAVIKQNKDFIEQKGFTIKAQVEKINYVLNDLFKK